MTCACFPRFSPLCHVDGARNAGWFSVPRAVLQSDGAGKWRISQLVASKNMFNRRIRLMFERRNMMKSEDLCVMVSLTLQNLIL